MISYSLAWYNWIGLAMIAIGAFQEGRRFERRNPKHVHKWGKWGEWGITYQARYCVDCNKMEVS